MKVIGIIDSMNFSSTNIEQIFYNDDYIIEDVKSPRGFNPKRWSETFGKALTRNIIEAKIIHTSNGLTLPIKTYSVSKQKQTLEFAGLNGYTQTSSLLKQLLKSLLEHLEDSYIVRIDIAIDFNSKVPNRIIKTLCKHRIAFNPNGWNTTYYKSKKEKKSNANLDIKKYNKSKKSKLNYELERLEFAFKGQYFNKLQIKDLKKAFKKMEKSIKKFAGLEVKILSI
jgi:hypothetical protein